MNIESFKIFCLVVDEGSISQAARLAFISQPAVTKQIHQLEDYYGTLLFDRTKGGKLAVTEFGRRLYPYASSIVNEFSHSKEAIKQLLNHQKTHLRVGASLTIGEYLLPRLLGDFRKKVPEVNVSLSIGNTPRIIEELENNVIDLALVEGGIENKELSIEQFGEDELILIYPPHYSWKSQAEISIENLIDEKMIWREPTSGTRIIIENTLKAAGVAGKIQNFMELGSTQAIKGAVEAGLGISILSRLAVARELQQGLLREVKIKGIEFKRELWMVKKPKRFYQHEMNQFIEFVSRVSTH
ncbi:molybdate transport repressor ModE-like protein [Pullulanibacillus pueri]|uniref:LysR family transcriptional regulator n=1 Tax=Pullulanibacillus pueri TaxID=1437324 RepID=A0A8J2ZUT5_9BACL|nr:LysR family transcriptional regulator [Pullulanibacillus pueri]MBM7682051.1 molybdate transport repressor ModE-like protein [Pullulanibacillus pueri]GGH80165.1 LysR family transcriptional regulator [Pullulanibacillus pueri]